MSRRTGIVLAMMISLGFHGWLLSSSLPTPKVESKPKTQQSKTVTVTLNEWQPPTPPKPEPVPTPEPVVEKKPEPKPPKPKPKRVAKPKPVPVKKSQPMVKPKPSPLPEKSPVKVAKPKPSPVIPKQSKAPKKPPAPDPSILENYLAELRSFIETHKHYPIPARRLRHEGIVEVAFVIGLDGTIRQVRLAKESPSRFLNQAALECVKELERFKPPPHEIAQDQLALTIPITFKII